MSVDIAWDTFTSGEDGAALAEHIRDFIHEKFQQITLPRFINAVHVHSFEFGSVCPTIEIKDVCDPLPDFYEDEDEDDEDEESDYNASLSQHVNSSISSSAPPLSERNLDKLSHNTRGMGSPIGGYNGHGFFSTAERLAALDTGRPFPPQTEIHNQRKSGHHASGGSISFSRSSTSGIPGGTSNMNYFHFPMGGLSGAQTPLAAVASGTPLSPGPWHDGLSNPVPEQAEHRSTTGLGIETTPNLRPRTAGSISTPELGSPVFPASPQSRPSNYPTVEKVSDDLTLENIANQQTAEMQQSQPFDLQVVARVTYDGDVRMMLTAEILLDYPMPSFVSIPLKLSVTGVTFDGVAILAYIKKRMHFCFLDPEDARTLVGDSLDPATDVPSKSKEGVKSTMRSLLREIHVESEIGRQESGKQALKNVGKVEKFVLEQVRRIFEDEFVFPSFWTFLV